MRFDPYPDPADISIGQLRVAVCAVLRNETGEVLLQQRSDNGYWGLPGGGVERGETLHEAIIREVWEETGLTMEPLRLVGVYSDPAQHQIVRYPDGNVIHYVSIVLEGRIVGGEPTLCEETQALRWADASQLPEPFVPNHRLRLQDALAAQEAAFVR